MGKSKKKKKKKQCANDRSHHWPEKQTDNSKLIIKIRKSFYVCTGLLCMRKDALRNSRLSVSPRVRREKIRSEFKIIAVVRTDQLNCSRVSANEQSNVFCFFLKSHHRFRQHHHISLSSLLAPTCIAHDALTQYNRSTAENFNLQILYFFFAPMKSHRLLLFPSFFSFFTMQSEEYTACM